MQCRLSPILPLTFLRVQLCLTQSFHLGLYSRTERASLFYCIYFLSFVPSSFFHPFFLSFFASTLLSFHPHYFCSPSHLLSFLSYLFLSSLSSFLSCVFFALFPSFCTPNPEYFPSHCGIFKIKDQQCH